MTQDVLKYLQPNAVIPIDMETTTALVNALKERLAQPEQEPVAVVDVHEFYDNCANFSLLQKLPKGKHTLYTIPPQRTWVGLTPEEFHEACWESYVDPVTGECSTGDREYAVRWTEAKLKEKNT
jgi:hypothetical protein